ncbi:hypothetical protein B0G81_2348 [Paraburkholderia sp. BL6665CI2N2]|uniref:hypothetical protein n=1 Tax=Paraburkholderia sp. BL6665CI2N2 TaxID=1938806 RepID=UPI0010659DEC|nr:hypothetical protein [Paraburkholderia sp. BL6665CI2N2]TDY22068.1 hypothetical protein B0G81_2348 [Paraburkholderia sp. BL6665CI2N2]
MRRWALNHQLAAKTTLDVAHGALWIAFHVDHVAVTESEPLGNILRPLRFLLLEESTGSSPRNALGSDALTAAATWAKDARKPLAAEDLNFTKKMQLHSSVRRAHACLLGLLYAKYRQLREAKYF